MAKTVWGIDIGHSAIKAVKMVRTGATAEVQDFDVADIEPDEDDSTRPMRIQIALKELVVRKKIGATPVVLSIPGNQTFFRPFNLPPVPEKKVAEIVQYEARQQIPFPIEEVYWGWQRYESLTEGSELGVDVVAVRKDIVDQILATSDEIGLAVIGLQSTPLALFNFVRHEISPHETVLVLDSGARETDFLVVETDHWWVRPLPMSGNEITKVLEQKFRMPFAEAEDLKIKMAESKQAQKIFQVIEPTLRNLAGEVQRTMGYYKSLAKNTRIRNAYATGNSFRLMDLTKFLSQSLGMPVEVIEGLRRISVARSVDEQYFDQEFPGLTVALGLGLQGLGLGVLSPTTELLPESRRVEIAIAGKKPVLAAVVGMVVVTVLLSWVAAGNRQSELESAWNRTDGLIKSVTNNRDQLETVEKPIPFAHMRLQRWARIGRERGWYVDALRAISELAGDDGRPLVGPKAGLAGVSIKEFYMSRTPPVEGRDSGDDLSRFGQEPGVTVPFPRSTRRAQPQARRNRRGAAQKKKPPVPTELPPDKPMYCVLVGEIAPKVTRPPKGVENGVPRYELSLDPVDKLEQALKKVPRFKGVAALPRKPNLFKTIRISVYDENVGKMTFKEEQREYKEFLITWTYDDGSEIQPSPDAKDGATKKRRK